MSIDGYSDRAFEAREEHWSAYDEQRNAGLIDDSKNYFATEGDRRACLAMELRRHELDEHGRD